MSTDLPDVARVLHDYEVGREVGRGEFGIVWSARHRQLGREVAIKQLAGSVTATDESSARFRREARILAQMDHPHVVTVFDYREHDALRLLVMELLTGGTFADRRAAGMSVETAIASTLAAASGLHHAHEQGILHRDVKPENLMFDRRGTLKVTDFGIARVDVVDATVIDLTHAGQFFGTPAYVSPEQAGHTLGEGRVPIGAASDQYSLAAVLYEALCGQLTHDATGGAVALCTRRMNESARPLRTLAPDVPVEIEAVVMKALARDPMLRYATAEDFAVALGRAATDTLGADWLARSQVLLRDTGAIADAAHHHRGDSSRDFGAGQRATYGHGDVRVHRRRGIGDVVEGRPGRDADGDGAPRHIDPHDGRIGRRLRVQDDRRRVLRRPGCRGECRGRDPTQCRRRGLAGDDTRAGADRDAHGNVRRT